MFADSDPIKEVISYKWSLCFVVISWFLIPISFEIYSFRWFGVLFATSNTEYATLGMLEKKESWKELRTDLVNGIYSENWTLVKIVIIYLKLRTKKINCWMQIIVTWLDRSNNLFPE